MTVRRPRPLVIAHRGASGHRPENTLTAFELAIKQGADMIELDLHRTRDGAAVVLHDEDLESLGGAGRVAEATLDQVRALDAGDGERVPTLEEVLDHFGPRIGVNIEFKRSRRGAYRGLETQALATVEACGLLDQIIFSSRWGGMLTRLRRRSARARLGLVVSLRTPLFPVRRARALGAESIHPSVGLAGPRIVAAAHRAGLAVHVYTVDDAAEMRRLLEMGVDGLFTNFPERLRKLVDSPGGSSVGFE